MKIILIVVCLLAAAPTAYADDLPYQGAGLRLDFDPDVRLSKRLEFSGHLRLDLEPGGQALVAAAGLKFDASKYGWIAPRIGAVTEWTDGKERTAFLISVWKHFSFFHHWLNFGIESDHLIGADGYRYHGHYDVHLRLFELPTTADIQTGIKHLSKLIDGDGAKIGDLINPLAVDLGFQAEHQDRLVLFGPSLGFERPKSCWRAEVVYLIGVQEENRGQSIRLSFRLRL